MLARPAEFGVASRMLNRNHADLNEAAQAAPGPMAAAWREGVEIARTLALALCMALALRIVIFQPFTIPSSSMEPGLVTGDYIVVSKFAYGWSRASIPFNPPIFEARLWGRSPKRGDVVVFRLPRDPQEIWVKRVIGLPGDRVQVVGGRVVVNGQPIPQTQLGVAQDHDAPDRQVLKVRETQLDGRAYVTYAGAPGGAGDTARPYVVPAGFYFVMGDNRDNSLDSRWPADVGVGFLPAENLVGRAEVVVASWRPGSGPLKPWTWLSFQPDRFFKVVR